MSEIAVIGGGAWGTGIAIVLGRKGIASRPPVGARNRRLRIDHATRVNEKFLPGRRIPDSVTASTIWP